MSYNFKTLIVFDTSTLRQTEAGDIAYKQFSFGRTFNFLIDFIKNNNLLNNVSIAVSSLVIEELKIQKKKKYKEDIRNLRNIAKRLTGMPNFPEGSLNIPEDEFDISSYVEVESKKYFQVQDIAIIELGDKYAPTALRSMIKRVFSDKKAPFTESPNHSDIGFKDNVIWESLLNFEKVVDFDKIIFISKDGDYKGCEDEFIAKWNRHIMVKQNENQVEIVLKTDYGNYVDFRQIYEYTETEYFQDYLKDLLKNISIIQVLEGDYSVENCRVINSCSKVERFPDPEGDLESILIHTLIEVDTTINSDKRKIPVEIMIKLSDEEIKEIQDWNSNPTVI